MKNFFKNLYIIYIKPILKFCRLIDEQGDLSITNILIIIFAFKFAYAPMEVTSIQDMALALAAMGVYAGKHAITKITEAKKHTAVTQEVITKLKEFANIDMEE